MNRQIDIGKYIYIDEERGRKRGGKGERSEREGKWGEGKGGKREGGRREGGKVESE